MQNKKKAIEEIKKFEYMRNMAELRALSNLSLETPLNNEQFDRIMELKTLCLG